MRHALSLLFFAGLLASAESTAEQVYMARTASGLLVYTNRPPQQGLEIVKILEFSSTRPAKRRLASYRQQAALGSGSKLPPFSVSEIDALIHAAAATHGVEETLLRAIIHVESKFDPQARSPKGALGLMQLMPDTARRYGVLDGHDPAQNIDGGTRYLKYLLALFKGNVRLALAAYNAGETAVIRHGNRVPPFAETQAYVPVVLARYRAYAVDERR